MSSKNGVESVNSSSQKSSIQQSHSIMDQIWSETIVDPKVVDPNTVYDWKNMLKNMIPNMK